MMMNRWSDQEYLIERLWSQVPDAALAPHEITLTPQEIDWAKEGFKERNGVSDLLSCTCFDCPKQKANRCAYQWDAYNTFGDCLAQK
jgi:hypothetical protein